MDKYRKTVKRRIWFMGGAILIFIGLMAVSYIFQTTSENELSDAYAFVRGTQCGLFACMLMFMIIGICRYFKGLKDDQTLRKLYIVENDEREREIYNRIAVSSYRTSLFVVLGSGVIAGFFNVTVFCTLGAATLAMSVIGAGYKIFYRMKL